MARSTRHLGASRRDLFERLDRPALKPLPLASYVYAEWKQCRAGLDYHVDIGRHYYSVPHQLLKQKLWARITARTVEVYFKGQRVASHARTSGNRQHSTHRDHMPAHHRFSEDWTPERIRRQAVLIGPNVETFVDVIMRQRRHPEQGYRSCLGCCDWPRPSGAIAWMLLVVVPWRSMPGPTHRCIPFSRMVSIANLAPAPRTSLRSPTPISVARITSIEEDKTCLIIQRWISSKHSGLDGMAGSLRRDAIAGRHRRSDPR